MSEIKTPRILIDLDHTLLDTTQFKLALAKKADEPDQVIQNLHIFLYSDSIHFLKKALRSGWEVVIVTFGEKSWQEKKLRALKKYWPIGVRTIVSSSKKIDQIKHLETKNVIMIDDKAEEINAIKKEFPDVEMYWIRRFDGKYRDQAPAVPHHTITTLTEINLPLIT